MGKPYLEALDRATYTAPPLDSVRRARQRSLRLGSPGHVAGALGTRPGDGCRLGRRWPLRALGDLTRRCGCNFLRGAPPGARKPLDPPWCVFPRVEQSSASRTTGRTGGDEDARAVELGEESSRLF